jgi:GGDEF domain-containing protein
VDAALLDRLAGLPDRRFLEQHLRRLPRGTDVVLGMIDIHGVRHNPAAGLLLRRLTAILSQVLRQGDVIARYGESQFVVVLHDIGLGAAERIGKRMLRAVADQEWESLVPESRIGIDVGWAALDPSLRGIAAVTAALKALGEAQRARIT